MACTEQTFDFIIVGGGTAGCILAFRLASSHSKPSVLLLETGGLAADQEHRIPFNRYLNAFTRPDLDHGYRTTPQATIGGKNILYGRGKGLGGSSLTNFMVWTRGSEADFERWSELIGGAEEWEWQNVERAFREVERFEAVVPKGMEKWVKPEESGYGKEGFVSLSLPPIWEKEMTINFKALKELGYPINVAQNSGNPIGFGPSTITLENGSRSTSYSSLIRESEALNLTIWTDSQVTKVLFEGKKAVGVQLLDGKSVRANKEIILTAGSIDTPKLLLLSGVGSARELKKHGIEVAHDLPGVGKNIQDHVAVFIASSATSEYSDRVPLLLSPDNQAEALKVWTDGKNGPMATTFASAGLAFVKEKGWEEAQEFKDLPGDVRRYISNEKVPHVEYVLGSPLIAPAYKLQDPNISFVSSAMIAMNPQSRGSITLASTDPEEMPNIDMAIAQHPYDRYAIISGLRSLLRLTRTEALGKYVTGDINVPKSQSDDDIWAFFEENALLVWHANGSVMMGKEEDVNKDGKWSCVNRDLEVYGLERLRVADVSVCPITPSGHTQSTAYLIGQIAGEKIIEKYGL